MFDKDIIKNISAIYTIPKLLSLIYKKLNYEKILSKKKFFETCDTNYIQLKMAAHDLTVPWYIRGSLTSTIKTQKQINLFLKSLDI